MTSLYGLPELGPGLMYWPTLDGRLDFDEPAIGVLEVEPQTFWFAQGRGEISYQLDMRAFDHLRRLPHPKLVHGVGFPIGGTVAPEPKQVAAFVESIELLGAPWASEHLSFNRVRRGGADVDMGFLLPPLQTEQGIQLAVSNILALKEQLPVPFAFETGVNYLRPLDGELPDGEFFAAVSIEADCGILLDLHNVWANERNGRQAVADLVDQLPLDRVIEVHLAGGQEFDGYWVDAHSGLIPTGVMDLARRVIPRLPNLKAVIYEVMPEYVITEGLTRREFATQFDELWRLWALRGSDAGCDRGAARSALRVRADVVASPQEWEDALSSAVVNDREAGPAATFELSEDPGTGVLRRLIAAARAGKVADTLPLTTRLLLLTVGDDGLEDIFECFWASVPSERMAADEATNFVAFIMNGSPCPAVSVSYLHDVASFELAAHQAIITGDPQHVAFSVDPETVLSALREGRHPGPASQGDFQILVTAPNGP